LGATLLPLMAAVVAVVALHLARSSSAADSRPAAGAVVTGWAVGTAGCLHSRNWAAGAVLAVLAAPSAVLAGAGAAGRLAEAGLVLWGPGCCSQRRAHRRCPTDGRVGDPRPLLHRHHRRRPRARLAHVSRDAMDVLGAASGE
jgi:hypothetical protein